MNLTVLGAGAWGSALARLLVLGGHKVTLWAHNPAHLEMLRDTGMNEGYLPGIDLQLDWTLQPDLNKAVQKSEGLVVAVASKALRSVTSHLRDYKGFVISCTKGIEFDSGLTMSGVLHQTMPKAAIAAMSGPTLALEVARDVPAAIVAASEDLALAECVQSLFHRPSFRVYTSTDLVGVEMGGALKNVIAIAAGVGDGLGFGDNTKAALITRAIVEIQRLGEACGARAETFAGLSGLGDLTVTCFSKLSRNRAFGEALGKGALVTEVLISRPNVAEGYPATCSAHQLAHRLRISTPIIDEVYAMLYEGKDVRQAVQDLTTRESKPESRIL